MGQFLVDTGVTFKRCGEAERTGESPQADSPMLMPTWVPGEEASTVSQPLCLDSSYL